MADTHTYTHAMYAHSVATQEMGDEEEACLLAEASSRSSLLSVKRSVMDSVAPHSYIPFPISIT